FPLAYKKDPKTGQHVRTTQSRCQGRLRLFYRHGYVDRIEQAVKPSEGRKPNIHVLTNKAKRLLAGLYRCDTSRLGCRKIELKSEKDFLSHLVKTNDLRASLTYGLGHPAKEQFAGSVITWLDDATLKRLHSQDKMTLIWPSGRREQNVILIPDVYAHIRTDEPHDYHTFWEVDRGTQTGTSTMEGRRTWEKRILL